MLYKTLSSQLISPNHQQNTLNLHQTQQRKYKYKYTLVNANNSNLLLRKYVINKEQFNQENIHLQWRRHTQHPIPQIIEIYQDHFKHEKVIICQHIIKTLNQIHQLTLQQTIYCISELVLGYQQMMLHFHEVVINSEYIGFNNKGELLVWVSSDLVSSKTDRRNGEYLKDQTKIIMRIIQILQNKLKQNDLGLLKDLRIVKNLKFKNLLQYIIGYKQKHKLKIVPKIQNAGNGVNNVVSMSKNNLNIQKNDFAISNPFMPIHKQSTTFQNQFQPQPQKQACSSSQYMPNNRPLQRNMSLGGSQCFNTNCGQTFMASSKLNQPGNRPRLHHENRFSLLKPKEIPLNLLNTYSKTNLNVYDNNAYYTNNNDIKSNNDKNETKPRFNQIPKINFSYSHRRQPVHSPYTQSQYLIKQFASDKISTFTSNILHQKQDKINQFTLNLEDMASLSNKSISLFNNEKISHSSQRNIDTQEYTNKVLNKYYKQEQHKIMNLNLKQSHTTSHSHTYSHHLNTSLHINSNIMLPKTSMITNHCSLISDLNKSSNQQDYLKGNKNPLFISNNSQQSMFTTTKQSNCDMDIFTNNLYGNNNNNIKSDSDRAFYGNQNNYEEIRRKEKQTQMYTFGGLITTTEEQAEESTISKPTSSIDQNDYSSESRLLEHSSSFQFHPNHINTSSPIQQVNSGRLRMPKSSSKLISIQDLHNNMKIFTSQNKNISSENLNNKELQLLVQLNPSNLYNSNSYLQSYQTSNNNSPVRHQDSHKIGNWNPENTNKAYHLLVDQDNLHINQYNLGQYKTKEWKGIKGLLNQSNINDLKQSFHCGPEIRAPSNFKLDLLGKFGRQIGHSILPNQTYYKQPYHAHSTNNYTNYWNNIDMKDNEEQLNQSIQYN